MLVYVLGIVVPICLFRFWIFIFTNVVRRVKDSNIMLCFFITCMSSVHIWTLYRCFLGTIVPANERTRTSYKFFIWFWWYFYMINFLVNFIKYIITTRDCLFVASFALLCKCIFTHKASESKWCKVFFFENA